MKWKPNRREALLVVVGGIVSGFCYWMKCLFRAGAGPELPRTQVIAKMVRDHFDYLTLDQAGVLAFIEDRERQSGLIDLRRVPYTQYLMSTDFFIYDEDESRVVNYITLFDAYASPCFNPLSRGKTS